MSPTILALILGLISLTTITICWPNPLDREPPQAGEEPMAGELIRGSAGTRPTRRGDGV